MEESMTGINPTKPVVQSLETIAKQLNEQSDSLSQSLQKIDEKLAKLNIGLAVWPYKSDYGEVFLIGEWESKTAEAINGFQADDDQHYSTGWAIGYAKVESGWSICVVPVLVCRRMKAELGSEIISVTPEGDPVALLKAPRAIRIMAAERLPRLIEEIKAQAQRSIQAIQNARGIADML
jgi:hypothetical protein